MKKIYSLFTALILTSIIIGQSPEKMTFQAVIRDASNALLVNQNIGMQISILQGSNTGSALYVETHSPTSNSNGLVNIEIGSGNIISGNFSSINWGNGPFFIKTETDPNGNNSYSINGTSQLMSVPFALHAKIAEDVISPIYTIGSWPELGGYVFWVSADGKHGLVAEIQDQGLATWYGAKNIISDPTNHSADGQKFRDWRLPTKYELNEMYSSSSAIGSFGTKTYWTSIRSGNTTAWRQNFLSGIQFNATSYTINDFFFVRSVREF
tara:strand:- start:94 stop:894 length:801 start_codon:yes stop_codon:yes gene_type:complete